MARRKYTFSSRQEAEDAWRAADRQRLVAEWLVTAILGRRTVKVGTTTNQTAVGYFTTRHSAFVYALAVNKQIHCVSGIWDIDDENLIAVIRSLSRQGIDGDRDSYDLAALLETARQQAAGAVMAA